MNLTGLVGLCLFAVAAGRAVRALPLTSWFDAWIAWLALLTAAMVAAGQVLSLAGRLSQPMPWLAAAGGCAIAAWLFPRRSGGAVWPAMAGCRQAWRSASSFTRGAFILLATTALAAAVINLVSLATCRPTNWDAIASHLTRAAYFLQFDSLRAFDANYWAHDAHAHNAAILWVYVLGIVGSETLTQAIQFVYYLWGGLLVVALGREIFRSAVPAVMGGLVFWLLVEHLMEAITVQNDLMLHFFSGAAVYWLVRAARHPGRQWWWLAALCMCLAAGVKGTVVMHLPVWGVAAVYAAAAVRRRHAAASPGRNGAPPWRRLAGGAAVLIVMAMMLGDGIGYLANLRAFGHPIAPAAGRGRSFEDTPPAEVFRAGTKNLLRYAMDFVSLDGLNRLPGAAAAEIAVKRRVVAALRHAGVDLARGPMHVPFTVSGPASDEDFSWWGIMGALLIPAGAVLTLVRRRGPVAWMLVVAGAVYIAAQAYVGPYGPWRGRYFLFLATLWSGFTGSFFLPVNATRWAGHRSAVRATGRAALSVLLALGAASAIMATTWRDARPITLGFSEDRLGQMTARARDPKFTKLFRRFNATVPADASVAVCVPGDFFEYLLFGAALNRTLIPIRHLAAFESAHGPPDYLFYQYTDDAPLERCPPRSDDLPLSPHHFLRRIDGGPDTAVTRIDFENRFGMRFVKVPAGTYAVGSPTDEPGRLPGEALHRVTLTHPCLIQTREVTRRQWAAVMGPAPGALPRGCAECPVANVSWEDVQTFIAQLNRISTTTYRLPTEAEWEIAARAGTGTAFAGGPVRPTRNGDASLDANGWYAGNATGRPWPVGARAPNAWGLYDMHGNVWEWCADGFAPYPPGNAVDPKGDPAAAFRVVRGGSYDNPPGFCRSAKRNAFARDHRAPNLGFRLAAAPGTVDP